MGLSAVLTSAPEGGYFAFNSETGTTTQGETVEEALTNLREATELYLEEFPVTKIPRPLLTTFYSFTRSYALRGNAHRRAAP